MFRQEIKQPDLDCSLCELALTVLHQAVTFIKKQLCTLQPALVNDGY